MNSNWRAAVHTPEEGEREADLHVGCLARSAAAAIAGAL
jgi:hypothetical protein